MKTPLLTLTALSLAALARGADGGSGFAAELTVGLGASLHETNALAEHHGQADLSISVAIVREGTRGDAKAFGAMGGVIGFRATSDVAGGDDHWSRSDEIYLGPALHLWGSTAQEVRLAGGPDVITATRKQGAAYATATAIGGWAELQYYYRLRHDDRPTSAFGLALGIEGANVGFAGSRVPIGGYHLSALISSDF